MINCIIVDDERPAINVLEKYISKIDELKLLRSFTNPLEAIEFVNGGEVDLVFLDINMDELSGIGVMNIIGNKTKVIFCTAFSEFAVESYELSAVDYLMNPISFARFEKAVDRLNLHEKHVVDVPNDYVFVKADQKGKMIRIDIKDIVFIEAKGNYVAIHKMNQYVLVYSSLRDIENYLHNSNFIRVHKSYLVAESKIEMVEFNTIVLKNCSEKIPISKTYKENLFRKLKKRIFSK
jgi:two-component system, LytTR family, response regulator